MKVNLNYCSEMPFSLLVKLSALCFVKQTKTTQFPVETDNISMTVVNVLLSFIIKIQIFNYIFLSGAMYSQCSQSNKGNYAKGDAMFCGMKIIKT